MKLSTRSEYALLAVMELTRRHGNGLVRIEELAGGQRIPRKYLERILLTLRKGGVLRSRRGVGGGYELGRPPERITVAEVIRLMDGPLAAVRSVSTYFYAPSPIERNPELKRLFREVRDLVARKMERTSLASLRRKR